MASKITIKRSTAALPPSGLSFGELAFVQGTGLTANQLYVGISGASPVWVGAQISTTGSWTDNAAKTSLATQYAIDQRISSQISGGSPITTVSDNTNTNRYLVLSTSAAAGVTLFVDDSTGALTYNPSTGTLSLAGDLNVSGGNIFTSKGDATIFDASALKLSIGSAATGITMGATAGNFGIRNPSLTVGSSGVTATIFADDGNLILTTKNYSGIVGDPADSPAKIIINDNIGAGFVNIEGGDLRLGNKTISAAVSGVDIVFEGTTDNTNELKLTAGDPGADYTVTLPHLTDTLVGKATTDTFTNKTYDTAGTGNVFRIAGVTLSGVTGTGSVVLSTSPTITTSLVSGSTGFALLNTTATIVNFAGAATTLTMGATSGSATIRNPILIVGTTAGIITTDNGNLQLIPGVFSGYAGTLPSISIDAAPEATGFVNIEGGNLRLGRKTDASIVTTPVNLVFEGATDNASDTTLSVVDPTAARTILLPDASDTLVGKATIDTFTNKTFDTAGTGNVFRIAGVTLTANTGTGSNVLATSPTLVTPTLGVASATTINKVTLTAPATGSTITVADGKTLTASNTLTFTGTDTASVAFGAGGTVLYTGNLGTNVATFLATPSSANFAAALTDETGTGVNVFGTSPTITTSLVAGSSSFDLLNTTATTINFAGGASTALNIGHASGNANFAGNVIVTGDLTVNGTTTTLNTTTLAVEDFNITVGLTLTTANATCTGAGIGIGVGTGITFAYDHATSAGWLSSVNLDLATAKTYKIGGTTVLSSSALGSGVTGSSLTQVGTITSGTWSGSFGAVSGANLTNLTAGNLSGTIPSGVLGNSNVFIGTTSVALNRTSASLSLTGVNIDGNAATATSAISATNASNISVASETSDSTCFVTFITESMSPTGAKYNSALTYNAQTGELSATLIDGGSF